MEVVFIIGATLSFFMAFLVFIKNEKSTADYVLGLWLAFSAIYYIFLYLDTNNIELLRTINLIVFNTPLIIGAHLFLYVLLMVKSDNNFKPVYWLHGLPFLLFTLYSIFHYYSPSVVEKAIPFNITHQSLILFKTFFYLVSNPVYAVWSLFILRKHKQKISNNFSYTEQIDLIWLKYVVVGYGILWIIILITHFFAKFPVLAISPLGYVIYIALTFYIFFLGFFGLKQQTIYKSKPSTGKIFDDKTPDDLINKEDRYKKSGLKETEAREHLDRLLYYFDNERPYLNGKLSLNETATHLDLSSNHLSQIINEQLDKTFFKFVNEYRIKEVTSRLSKPDYKKYTLLTIAFESGFNTKSNFNRIFKKHTGLSPTQYIKKQEI